MDVDSASVLQGKLSRDLLGLDDLETAKSVSVTERLEKLARESHDPERLSCEIANLGGSALSVFLQANVTGPPVQGELKGLIPALELLGTPRHTTQNVESYLASLLTVDGEAVYQYIPYIEFFIYSKVILSVVSLLETKELLRARLRVNVWHQRLLSQPAPALQEQIEDNLRKIEVSAAIPVTESADARALFLLERSAIHALHGRDQSAEADLQEAARVRGFKFALTGRLGKRTKYQQKDTSQLVVLAKSSEPKQEAQPANGETAGPVEGSHPTPAPKTVKLEDDTLLASVSFTASESLENGSQVEDSIPPELAALDANNQPKLHPLDSIILLATATLTHIGSAQDELSREETLPYVERVLSGGSSNWQVYTQALIVRSRMQAFKSRTMETGVLQLQAVVDQVIAETASDQASSSAGIGDVATFLPRATQSESAPVSERLQYIHQIAPAPRWKLEAELADRWVFIGGLRTALDIYERLRMWAEVALCLAANERENEARKIICHQLFAVEEGSLSMDQIGNDVPIPSLQDPPPLDGPRLFCILGDLNNSVPAYEQAWEISNHRYARAQRSLGKFYMNKQNFERADDAYATSLKISPQNHPSWFALGCIRLQTENWQGAVEAFGRAVQIEDSDAESWSNMAIALLKMSDDDTSQKNLRSAFMAMKRAVSIKRDNSRMWQNYLAVAARCSPPPYAEIIAAQSRLIDLLGSTQGESAVDIPILETLFDLLFRTDEPGTDDVSSESSQTRFRESVTDLVFNKVAPLITSSRPLWLLVAKFNVHLKRPMAALSTYEKAWRSALNQPGWESTEKLWRAVVAATTDLLDAYESLGDLERESGLGQGEPVCKDWRFKSRSALRSVIARAKETWEGDEAFVILQDRLQDLKPSR